MRSSRSTERNSSRARVKLHCVVVHSRNMLRSFSSVILRPRSKRTRSRISDSDPDMLRFLAERGIAPGDRFEVVEKQPFDGPLFVRFGDSVQVLGGELARAMRVEVDTLR